jgi:transcriptional regulator with XRE-family HTH domain
MEMAQLLRNERIHKTISKYERGRSAPPIEVVLAYARAANIPLESIVDDEIDLRIGTER